MPLISLQQHQDCSSSRRKEPCWLHCVSAFKMINIFMATFTIIYAFATVTNIPDDVPSNSTASIILYLIITIAVLTVAMQFVQLIFLPVHYTSSQASRRTLIMVVLLDAIPAVSFFVGPLLLLKFGYELFSWPDHTESPSGALTLTLGQAYVTGILNFVYLVIMVFIVRKKLMKLAKNKPLDLEIKEEQQTLILNYNN